MKRNEGPSAIPRLEPEVAVHKFNSLFPVGTLVDYWRGAREFGGAELTPSGRGRLKHKATVLSGHTAVAWIEGCSGCIALTHVRPVPEGPTNGDTAA